MPEQRRSFLTFKDGSTQHLASDLRPGDVVEGRTVEWIGTNVDGSTRVRWRDDGNDANYPRGVLVLVERWYPPRVAAQRDQDTRTEGEAP